MNWFRWIIFYPLYLRMMGAFWHVVGWFVIGCLLGFIVRGLGCT